MRRLARTFTACALMTMASAAPAYAESSGTLNLPAEGALLPAVRLSPPTTTIESAEPSRPAFDGSSIGPDGRGGRCIGAEPLLAYYSPGWDVVRMSHIMKGESGCNPRAYNRRGHAHGLLQITPITFPYLAGALGTTITSDKLFDAVFNIRAAAALFRAQGYAPWRL